MFPIKALLGVLLVAAATGGRQVGAQSVLASLAPDIRECERVSALVNLSSFIETLADLKLSDAINHEVAYRNESVNISAPYDFSLIVPWVDNMPVKGSVTISATLTPAGCTGVPPGYNLSAMFRISTNGSDACDDGHCLTMGCDVTVCQLLGFPAELCRIATRFDDDVCAPVIFGMRTFRAMITIHTDRSIILQLGNNNRADGSPYPLGLNSSAGIASHILSQGFSTHNYSYARIDGDLYFTGGESPVRKETVWEGSYGTMQSRCPAYMSLNLPFTNVTTATQLGNIMMIAQSFVYPTCAPSNVTLEVAYLKEVDYTGGENPSAQIYKHLGLADPFSNYFESFAEMFEDGSAKGMAREALSIARSNSALIATNSFLIQELAGRVAEGFNRTAAVAAENRRMINEVAEAAQFGIVKARQYTDEGNVVNGMNIFQLRQAITTEAVMTGKHINALYAQVLSIKMNSDVRNPRVTPDDAIAQEAYERLKEIEGTGKWPKDKFLGSGGSNGSWPEAIPGARKYLISIDGTPYLMISFLACGEQQFPTLMIRAQESRAIQARGNVYIRNSEPVTGKERGVCVQMTNTAVRGDMDALYVPVQMADGASAASDLFEHKYVYQGLSLSQLPSTLMECVTELSDMQITEIRGLLRPDHGSPDAYSAILMRADPWAIYAQADNDTVFVSIDHWGACIWEIETYNAVATFVTSFGPKDGFGDDWLALDMEETATVTIKPKRGLVSDALMGWFNETTLNLECTEGKKLSDLVIGVDSGYMTNDLLVGANREFNMSFADIDAPIYHRGKVNQRFDDVQDDLSDVIGNVTQIADKAERNGQAALENERRAYEAMSDAECSMTTMSKCSIWKKIWYGFCWFLVACAILAMAALFFKVVLPVLRSKWLEVKVRKSQSPPSYSRLGARPNSPTYVGVMMMLIACASADLHVQTPIGSLLMRDRGAVHTSIETVALLSSLPDFRVWSNQRFEITSSVTSGGYAVEVIQGAGCPLVETVSSDNAGLAYRLFMDLAPAAPRCQEPSQSTGALEAVPITSAQPTETETPDSTLETQPEALATVEPSVLLSTTEPTEHVSVATTVRRASGAYAESDRIEDDASSGGLMAGSVAAAAAVIIIVVVLVVLISRRRARAVPTEDDDSWDEKDPDGTRTKEPIYEFADSADADGDYEMAEEGAEWPEPPRLQSRTGIKLPRGLMALSALILISSGGASALDFLDGDGNTTTTAAQVTFNTTTTTISTATTASTTEAPVPLPCEAKEYAYSTWRLEGYEGDLTVREAVMDGVCCVVPTSFCGFVGDMTGCDSSSDSLRILFWCGLVCMAILAVREIAVLTTSAIRLSVSVLKRRLMAKMEEATKHNVSAPVYALICGEKPGLNGKVTVIGAGQIFQIEDGGVRPRICFYQEGSRAIPRYDAEVPILRPVALLAHTSLGMEILPGAHLASIDGFEKEMLWGTAGETGPFPSELSKRVMLYTGLQSQVDKICVASCVIEEGYGRRLVPKEKRETFAPSTTRRNGKGISLVSSLTMIVLASMSLPQTDAFPSWKGCELAGYSSICCPEEAVRTYDLIWLFYGFSIIAAGLWSLRHVKLFMQLLVKIGDGAIKRSVRLLPLVVGSMMFPAVLADGADQVQLHYISGVGCSLANFGDCGTGDRIVLVSLMILLIGSVCIITMLVFSCFSFTRCLWGRSKKEQAERHAAGVSAAMVASIAEFAALLKGQEGRL